MLLRLAGCGRGMINCFLGKRDSKIYKKVSRHFRQKEYSEKSMIPFRELQVFGVEEGEME